MFGLVFEYLNSMIQNFFFTASFAAKVMTRILITDVYCTLKFMWILCYSHLEYSDNISTNKCTYNS